MPARGVERWLSQRLSHVLGRGRASDGVCAGVAFRSPGSLIAEITGTVDDDPWSPDAMTWPLLEVIDCSLDEPWCRTLATHLGHFRDDRRRGRVASGPTVFGGASAGRIVRLLRPAASAAAGRLAGRPCARPRRRPAWQPELWRALVDRIEADPPHIRHQKTVARLREGPTDLPQRLSLFGHTRLASTDVELLDALATHHDLHLWLPHPSDDLWQALTDIHGAVPRRRRHQPEGSPSPAAGNARPRSARAATRTASQPRDRRIPHRCNQTRHTTGLAAVRHCRQRGQA